MFWWSAVKGSPDVPAQPSHASATIRDVPAPQPSARPNHTGGDTTRQPSRDPVADLRPDRSDNDAVPSALSRQDSTQSVTKPDVNQPNDFETPYNARIKETKVLPQNEEDLHDKEEVEHEELEPQNYSDNNLEQIHTENPEYDQSHVDNTPFETLPADNSQYEQSHVPETEQYEPNADTTEYPAQEYDQQHYEQGYTEGQQGQYENYEQYPQQYTDPNAQYEGQYENYATDGNYQGDQNFDQTQYDPGYTAEYQEPQPTTDPQIVDVESKRSNSPNEKLLSQS